MHKIISLQKEPFFKLLSKYNSHIPSLHGLHSDASLLSIYLSVSSVRLLPRLTLTMTLRDDLLLHSPDGRENSPDILYDLKEMSDCLRHHQHFQIFK